MGKSKSQSTSITTTNTTTQNYAYDQRVAGADKAIVIGAGAGDVVIDQTPEEVFTGLFDLNHELLQRLEAANKTNYEAQVADSNESQSQVDQINKALLIGLGVLVLVIVWKKVK